MKSVAFRVITGIVVGSCLLAGCTTNSSGLDNSATDTPTAAPVIEKIHFSGSGEGTYNTEKKHFNGGDYEVLWSVKNCDMLYAWFNQNSTQAVFEVENAMHPKDWHGKAYLYNIINGNNFLWMNAANGTCSWTADFTSIQ